MNSVGLPEGAVDWDGRQRSESVSGPLYARQGGSVLVVAALVAMLILIVMMTVHSLSVRIYERQMREIAQTQNQQMAKSVMDALVNILCYREPEPGGTNENPIVLEDGIRGEILGEIRRLDGEELFFTFNFDELDDMDGSDAPYPDYRAGAVYDRDNRMITLTLYEKRKQPANEVVSEIYVPVLQTQIDEYFNWPKLLESSPPAPSLVERLYGTNGLDALGDYPAWDGEIADDYPDAFARFHTLYADEELNIVKKYKRVFYVAPDTEITIQPNDDFTTLEGYDEYSDTFSRYFFIGQDGGIVIDRDGPDGTGMDDVPLFSPVYFILDTNAYLSFSADLISFINTADVTITMVSGNLLVTVDGTLYPLPPGFWNPGGVSYESRTYALLMSNELLDFVEALLNWHALNAAYDPSEPSSIPPPDMFITDYDGSSLGSTLTFQPLHGVGGVFEILQSELSDGGEPYDEDEIATYADLSANRDWLHMNVTDPAFNWVNFMSDEADRFANGEVAFFDKIFTVSQTVLTPDFASDDYTDHLPYLCVAVDEDDTLELQAKRDYNGEYDYQLWLDYPLFIFLNKGSTFKALQETEALFEPQLILNGSGECVYIFPNVNTHIAIGLEEDSAQYIHESFDEFYALDKVLRVAGDGISPPSPPTYISLGEAYDALRDAIVDATGSRYTDSEADNALAELENMMEYALKRYTPAQTEVDGDEDEEDEGLYAEP